MGFAGARGGGEENRVEPLGGASQRRADSHPETVMDKEYIEAEPDWTASPCPHLSEMPAIQWKLQNLRKLRRSNPRKFADQSKELKERLGL